ncbi:MAG TPA: hypothetical protein VLF59_03040 [Candidatus Saccharimonadales bacterium]|nr:hypothetical protein [Candidatus Saccharimonadales bacterium]
MKVLVLYRPNSEFSRTVEEFVQELQTRHNLDEKHLQVIDYDSREGAATASMYDLMRQPAVLVVSDQGGYIKSWEGETLPVTQEVASYTFQMQ